MNSLEYYKIIKNSTQFLDAELVKMNCIKKDYSDDERNENDFEVKMLLKRKVNVISRKKANIYLQTKVGIPNGLFDFDVTYKGLCVTTLDIDESTFEQYAYDQVVPLLLPYVRECISSTLARMGLPVFTLPTIDVLNSMEVNMNQADFERD